MYTLFTSPQASADKKYPEIFKEFQNTFGFKNIKEELKKEFTTPFTGKKDIGLSLFSPVYSPALHFGMFLLDAVYAIINFILASTAAIVSFFAYIFGAKDLSNSASAYMKMTGIMMCATVLDGLVNFATTFVSPFSEAIKFGTRAITTYKESTSLNSTEIKPEINTKFAM